MAKLFLIITEMCPIDSRALIITGGQDIPY